MAGTRRKAGRVLTVQTLFRRSSPIPEQHATRGHENVAPVGQVEPFHPASGGFRIEPNERETLRVVLLVRKCDHLSRVERPVRDVEEGCGNDIFVEVDAPRIALDRFTDGCPKCADPCDMSATTEKLALDALCLRDEGVGVMKLCHRDEEISLTRLDGELRDALDQSDDRID